MESLDFTRAAELITDFTLAIRPGEDVLIIRDSRSGGFPGVSGLFEALMSSIHRKGAEPQVVSYVTRPLAGVEPPMPVAAAMKSSAVVIIMSTLSILQTVATTEALKSGSRVLVLPPARYIQNSPDMLYRLLPTDPEEETERMRLAERIAEVFRSGRQVKIVSQKGTDIRLGIGKLNVLYNPTTARMAGQTTIIPGGQVVVGTVPGEAEGKFVVDASASPIYRPLRQPIEMVVQEGKVVEISGEEDAREYRGLLEGLGDPHVYEVAEIGVGINPHAKLSGTPLEDERIFGAVWIAVGTNVHIGGSTKAAIHSDCVMLPPVSVTVDGRVILSGGEYHV